MSPVDNTAIANKKNLIEKSKLNFELHRIEKEKRADMRLMNNAKQRFKNRYAKYESINLSEARGSNDRSDIVVYERHTPGCYRKNRECRITQSPIKNTSLAYNDIHAMVFSEDEIDLDKILCLHLLRAHSAETLTPPPKNQKFNNMGTQREQCPLERLIDRSKKKHIDDRLIKSLPIHILNVNPNNTNENLLIRDGRLAARIIINEKINELIVSVMSALEQSNSEKLKEFLTKAHNNDYLREMICHPDMQGFINSLNGFNVISCCESFRMTSPFRYAPIELKVRTASGYLEILVNQIRRNIFKLPINCCWEPAGGNFFNLYYNPLECPKRTEECEGHEREIFSQALDVKEPKDQKESTSKGYSRDDDDDDSRRVMYKNPGTFNQMNLDKVADFINKKANSAIQRDLRNLQIVFPEPPEVTSKDDEGPSKDEPSSSSSGPGHNHKRYSLKQTMCPACSEKWKIPLPAPKTSVVRKSAVGSSAALASSHQLDSSSHQISVVLDRELKFWNEYNTKSSKSVISASMRFTPARYSRNNVIEIIDLDELDLARIRQVIREREAKKKMEKFMSR